jgi:hypothetical protein
VRQSSAGLIANLSLNMQYIPVPQRYPYKVSPLSEHYGTLTLVTVAVLSAIVVVAVVLPVYFFDLDKTSNSNNQGWYTQTLLK